LVDEEEAKALEELGVRDSKKLSSRRREKLAPRIKNVAVRCSYVELQPSEIDKFVLSQIRLRKLNFLEARAMAVVIEDLRPEVAYVDASDVLAERFGRQILKLLSFDVEVVSEHEADAKYPVVSAASILAKVRRDEVVLHLSERFGCLGSGYGGDSKTISFLRSWINSHRSHPWFVRKSWATAKRIMDEVRQARL